MADPTTPFAPPSSILIIGSGVFGLSTAYHLTLRPLYASTRITLLDASPFPNPHASSIDSSRIIRADYSDPAYSLLAARAQTLWRTPFWGSAGRYTESGLLLCADRSQAEYVRKSHLNVTALSLAQSDARTAPIVELDSPAAIAAASKTGSDGDACATWGYLNPASGWADAEASMRFLHGLVVATGRVEFITGRAAALAFSDPSLLSSPYPSSSSSGEGRRARTKSKVLGAHLTDGRTLLSDLTILATGAWTSSLLDVRSTLSATAQCVAYLPLSPAELARLADMPTILNLSTGCFVIPPHPGKSELKVARHAYGYRNLVEVAYPEPCALASTSASSAASPTSSAPAAASAPASDPKGGSALKGPSVPPGALRGPLRGAFPSPPPSSTSPPSSPTHSPLPAPPPSFIVSSQGGHNVAPPVTSSPLSPPSSPTQWPPEGPRRDTRSSLPSRPSKGKSGPSGGPPGATAWGLQGATMLTSLPSPPHTPLPADEERVLQDALHRFIPWLPARPFASTRLCWYTDTRSGDFLVDRHPRYDGLVVATGGSGHAFKFLPVLGGEVLDMLEGRLEAGLRGRWAWREREEKVAGKTNEGGDGGKRRDGGDAERREEEGGGDGDGEGVWTEDGSRAGKKGGLLSPSPSLLTTSTTTTTTTTVGVGEVMPRVKSKL